MRCKPQEQVLHWLAGFGAGLSLTTLSPRRKSFSAGRANTAPADPAKVSSRRCTTNRTRTQRLKVGPWYDHKSRRGRKWQAALERESQRQHVTAVIYRCNKCTSVGCDQLQAGECSNQGFRLGTCVKCGTIKLAEDLRLVMTPQLRKAFKILRLPLPEGTEKGD